MEAHKALVAEHRVYDFRGSAFDIGVQHGRAVTPMIRVELERAMRRLSAPATALSPEGIAQRVLDANRRLFQDRVPRVLEEIRGLAEGAGLSYAQAFLVATSDGIERLPGGAANEACTALACGKSTTADQHVLIGQNKDVGPSCERYHIMRYDYADAHRRMVLLNYAGWMGNIGMTSNGMSFSGNSRYAQQPAGEMAPYSLLKRLVLECTNVAQVLNGIKGLVFANGAFLVADRSGHIVFIECVAGNVRLTDLSTRAFGSANSVLAEDLRKFELPATGPCSSPVRQRHVQARLDQLAARGNICIDDLKKVLADHEDFPLSVCRHACEADDQHTNASFLADLTAGQIHIALGNPCAAEYRAYDCR